MCKKLISKKCIKLLSVLLLCFGVLAFHETTYANESDKDFVVVLDPGHDSTHAGASYFGAKEDELVLKITQYCKAELEQYENVSVSMIRQERSCPYGNSVNASKECNESRIKYAQSMNADIYISFHLNSSTNSSVQGSGVFYQNTNYVKEFGIIGKGLAQAISNHLTSLGIQKWSEGILIRNSEDGTKYPDGSLADYYAILRLSKLSGFPAVLIEHAFLSNQSDYNNFLSNDEKLKSIGVADATAIAEYYGLEKKKSDNSGSTSDNSGSTSDNSGNNSEKKILVQQADGKWYCVSNGKVQKDYTGFVKYNNSLCYVRKGIWEQKYTGLAQNDDGWWYVKNGKVDYTKNGLVQYNGTWYNVVNGYLDWSYSNLVKYNGTWYYVKNGSITWKYSDIIQYGTKWYYIKNNQIASNYTGLAQGHTGWWYIKKGKVDFTKNGLVQYNGTWYNVVNGYLKWSFSDFVSYNGNLYYVKNGSITWKYSDIVPYKDNWYYVKNNQIASNYTGLAQGHTGWWYIKEGKVDFTKNGLVQYNGTWYNVIDGYLKWSYSNFVSYNGNLYYVKNGSITWKYSDIVPYKDSWYYVKNNQIASNYTGLAQGHTGWWFIQSGKVDFTQNGLVKYNGTWYNVVNGYLSWNYTNLVKYNNNWYYVKNGSLNLNYVGVVSCNDSMYYINKGKVNESYTGIVSDGDKKWYIRKGVVDTAYNGTITQDGTTYSIINGQAIEEGTAIMGKSTTTVEKMVAFYNKNASYPEFYKNSDAPNIETFCKIYLEESNAEGVNAEVAFCQAMLETGFLKYGGQVDISQYNFAGIGALNGGANGASFPDVRTGVRAQVQHLKAYACEEPLKNACVDPRFQLVKRGCAPFVEWLGIQENPYTEWGTKSDGSYGILVGRGWASAKNYGYTIKKSYMDKL